MTKINDASFLTIVETVDGQEVDITPKPTKPTETQAPKKDTKGGKP